MLMPDKHIRWAESLLGLSAYLLERLSEPRTIDQLWDGFKLDRKEGRYPASHSFENLVIALDVLFAVGPIDASHVESEGVLRRCD